MTNIYPSSRESAFQVRKKASGLKSDYIVVASNQHHSRRTPNATQSVLHTPHMQDKTNKLQKHMKNNSIIFDFVQIGAMTLTLNQTSQPLLSHSTISHTSGTPTYYSRRNKLKALHNYWLPVISSQVNSQILPGEDFTFQNPNVTLKPRQAAG